MAKWLMSLMIAFLASVFDQAYHILTHAPHSVLTLASGVPTPAGETLFYVGAKFLIVFLVSWMVLALGLGENALVASSIIAVAAAVLFGAVMTLFIPASYGLFIHMFHAIAIFFAGMIVIGGKNQLFS